MLLLTLLVGCTTTTQRLGLPPLEAVEALDLDRYLGTWYEIASYPQRFQRGCTGTTATYELRDDGLIQVINECRKGGLDEEPTIARGRARVPDADAPGQLEVSFFGPFWGPYWVVELDEDYELAAVSSPGRDSLWILSRTPQLTDEVFDGLLATLETEHDLDPSRLEETLQPAE